MEGGVPEADISAFRECMSLSCPSTFISGALLYIRDDFKDMASGTYSSSFPLFSSKLPRNKCFFSLTHRNHLHFYIKNNIRF
ncbi:hypothetical protein MTR_5g077570 [Medicago truncatula]|uniref:Uncharacterized protein n=1 Tax=Medicago truncatula TaxID=3880 RepID=G7KFZ9_MEDTR|nr:hypothetical protein MTR_5g077570 [Medicago truncatula]